MDEAKKLEIKNIIEGRWEEDKISLCNDIMEGFIFGTYANNEHYRIDDIISIWDEIYLERNPLPEPEVVVEEPVEESIDVI